MAFRKKTTAPTFTFKLGDDQFRILTGQSRDFLSIKPKDGEWVMLDDAASQLMVKKLEAQLARLRDPFDGEPPMVPLGSK